MKIEKISDNQIRCTLTKEDLDSHQIRISELAYGTDKAKKLFREMMQQAQIEFGFEADNIPLMIEAIPVNGESVILIVTKVEDPEELDTRFSKFSPYKKKPSRIPFISMVLIISSISSRNYMRRHRKQPLRELLPVTRRSKNLELPGLPEVRKLLNLFPIPGKFR